MAGGIRFTNIERLATRNALSEYTRLRFELGFKENDRLIKACESVNTKLDTAEVAPKKKSGMSVGAAVEAFQGVLGRRLVLPPNPGAGWYAQMGQRLAALGMTPDLCRAAATVAATEWAGLIKAESIIRQADTLLHTYQSDDFNPGQQPLPTSRDLDEEEM